MKKLLSPLFAAILLLQSCATAPKAEDIKMYLRPGAFVACQAVFAFVSEPQDKQDLANDIWTVSTVIYSLSGGVPPTPEQVQAALALATPKSKEFGVLAATLSGLWAGAYPRVSGNPKLALDALHELALGAQDAARPYTTK